MDKELQQNSSTTMTTDSSSRRRRRPEMYLVICNISKKANIKTLLQSAAAFGCQEIFVVGQKKFDFDSSHEGSDVPPKFRPHIQSEAIVITRFDKWHECVEHLEQQNIQLIGVEIRPNAKPIEAFLDNTNQRDIAFIMGNEGRGLNDKQMKSCHAFVRIPQYGKGTASLNVSVAASIVMHRFYEWQQQQQQRQQHRSTTDD